MRYQNVKAFQKHLSSAAPHNLCRVYLIAIPDDFERAEMLQSIVSLLQGPDASPRRFTTDNFALRDLCDALMSPSLFEEEPVVIFDGLDKVGKKELQPLFDAPPTAGYLLLGSKTKTPFATSIEKWGVILDLTEEKPWDKERRIAEELAARAINAGKRFAPDALQMLIDRTEKDVAFLISEVDKLICFVGDRPLIEKEDVCTVSLPSRTHTLWQTAEEVIWEGASLPPIDSSAFHGLIPLFRSQLQIGLKIASLLEARTPPDEWNLHLPKMWPKTLEKRSSSAAQLGAPFFQRGLKLIFEIELLSRTGSTQYGALLDLFRANLRT